MKKIKILIFYIVVSLPILLISTTILYYLFFTSLPQKIYIDILRNIYFDCLVGVEKNYVYTAIPGKCVLNNIEYSTIINSGKYGFRNLDDGKPELILIGDSHTHGFGVNDNETFSSILSGVYGYKTLNLGIGSYATKRELETLKEFSSTESVVVIQYCDNDAGENQFAINNSDVDFKNAVKNNWIGIVQAYKTKKELGFRSVLNEIVNYWKLDKYTTKEEFYKSYSQRDIASEAKNFAIILSSYSNILKQKKIVLFESAGHGLNHPEFAEQFSGAIKKYAPTVDFIVLDSTQYLNHGDYYFFDDHLNRKGHAKVARMINSVLLELGIN